MKKRNGEIEMKNRKTKQSAYQLSKGTPQGPNFSNPKSVIYRPSGDKFLHCRVRL